MEAILDLQLGKLQFSKIKREKNTYKKIIKKYLK